MASVTTFDCDNCGRSIPDPGSMTEVRVEEVNVKNGLEYAGPTKLKKELCDPCSSSLMKIIEKGLRSPA